jgi:hypothetical protein
MKRSGFLKRSKPLRQRRREGADVERSDKPWAAALSAVTVKPLARGSYAGSTSGPASKTEAYRDPVLLEMARGRPCLLMVPGLCCHRTDTTVAAHSNSQEHGKGMGRKADDCYSAWACVSCHVWLDQGKADAARRERAFMEGHARQVLAWRLIALDEKEPERFRRAARRALKQLGATPLGEVA